MTCDEFLSTMRARGTTFAHGASQQAIGTANLLLQEMRAAMFPRVMLDFYSACGGGFRGTAYIFGPTEMNRGATYPVPNIIEINKDMSHISALRGKTIFGRNDMFFFAFDAFGTFFMLDTLNLRILRKYDDAYHAMTDCLAAGNI